MSMEERCEQFHKDAQAQDPKRRTKEIDRLRKFLHKNQDHRFTDREASHLFQAVQCHVTAAITEQQQQQPSPGSGQAAGEDDDPPALQLLEDALKMPFTVFSTSQKKTMLKWLEKLRPQGAGGGGNDGQTQDTASTWTVTDISEGGSITVMDEEGNEITVTPANEEVGQQVRSAFDAGDAPSVRLTHDNKKVAAVL